MKIRAKICEMAIGAFLMVALSYCAESEKSNTAAGRTNSKNFEEIPGWIGIYQDTLPCEDCQGLLTWLEFYSNGHFKRISTKIGFEDVLSNTFSEKGTWRFNPKSGVLQLEDSLKDNPLFLLPQGDSVMILCKSDGSSFQAGTWKLRRRITGDGLPETDGN